MKSLLKIAELMLDTGGLYIEQVVFYYEHVAGHLGAVPAGDDHAVGGVALGRDRGLAVRVAGRLACVPSSLVPYCCSPPPLT